LTVAQAVTLMPGATLHVLLNGATPSLQVGGTLTLGDTNRVRVYLAGAVTPGTNVLVDYTGALAGDGFAALRLAPLPGGAAGFLSNNVADTRIELVVTAVGAGIKWDGDVNGRWDFDVTPNWLVRDTLQDTFYVEFDPVLFDDTASGATAVTLVGAHTPSSLIFSNHTAQYTLAGDGIGGPVSLVKHGAGLVTLSNANSFSGGAYLFGGRVRAGHSNALGSQLATVVISNATYDINGFNTGENLLLSGDGAAGSKARW
jgi:autotransporter-associated beta strand protein